VLRHDPIRSGGAQFQGAAGAMPPLDRTTIFFPGAIRSAIDASRAALQRLYSGSSRCGIEPCEV
jgi:hypothetical protein